MYQVCVCVNICGLEFQRNLVWGSAISNIFFSVFETHGDGCEKERRDRILALVSLFCHYFPSIE